MSQQGRPYLAIPGPSVIPEKVLNAMHRPSPDIYKGELHEVTASLIPDLQKIAQTESKVAIYIANGHGAWEAAIANTLSYGEHVLVLATGRFAFGWGEIAENLGINLTTVDFGKSKGIDLEKLMMSYFEIHQSNPDFPAFFINILAYKNAPGYALLAEILDSKREKINQLVSRSQNSGLVKHDLDVDVFRILLMSLSVFPFLIKGVLAESSKVPLNSELLRKVAKSAGVMLATMIKPSDKAC